MSDNDYFQGHSQAFEAVEEYWSRFDAIKFEDEALHQQAIAEAKRKFSKWPSRYASTWMVRRYKELLRNKKGR